jgi:hypothetical protein
LLRSIREGRKSSSWRNDSEVISFSGAVSSITFYGITCRKSPAIFTVTGKFFSIEGAPLPVYESLISILLPIVCIFVFQVPGIKTQV